MGAARILIVEDEIIVAKDLETTLRGLGYQVLGVAFSGEEAIRKAAESHPDLVVMDIKLKGAMDGVEAAKEIHDRFEIPAVYLTAFSRTETQRVRKANPCDYVLKPFAPEELHAAVEKALQTSKKAKTSN